MDIIPAGSGGGTEKIVYVSGNFIARGEPLLSWTEWTRAQITLENGADLKVVELPFLVSVQAADFFGQRLWIILARLGIDF